MREILFRGKRKGKKGNWVEGYYVLDESGQIKEKPITFIYHLNTHPCGFDVVPCEVIPETIGQYTGLCDKNGKKIFEGDIIHSFYANCKINEYVEKVVFRDGSFKAENVEGGFFAKIAGQGSPKHLPNDTSVYMIECEVIGNIHDNPELLKGGAE